MIESADHVQKPWKPRYIRKSRFAVYIWPFTSDFRTLTSIFYNYLLHTSSCLYSLFPSPRDACVSLWPRPLPLVRTPSILHFQNKSVWSVCPSVYKCACPLWDDLHEWLSGLSIIPGHAPFGSQRKMIGWWWWFLFFCFVFLERCNTPPFCLFNISLIWQ